jgi:hypothetical protein
MVEIVAVEEEPAKVETVAVEEGQATVEIAFVEEVQATVELVAVEEVRATVEYDAVDEVRAMVDFPFFEELGNYQVAVFVEVAWAEVSKEYSSVVAEGANAAVEEQEVDFVELILMEPADYQSTASFEAIDSRKHHSKMNLNSRWIP